MQLFKWVFFCFNWVLVYRYQILGRDNQICYILATSICSAGHCKTNHIPQNCSAMTETSQKQTRNNQNPVPLPWLSSSVVYEFIGCGWAIAELLSTPTKHCSTVAHSDQTSSTSRTISAWCQMYFTCCVLDFMCQIYGIQSSVNTAQAQIVWGSHISRVKWGMLTLAQQLQYIRWKRFLLSKLQKVLLPHCTE